MKSSVKEQDEQSVIRLRNIYLTTESENAQVKINLKRGCLTLSLIPHILELCVTSRHLPSW